MSRFGNLRLLLAASAAALGCGGDDRQRVDLLLTGGQVMLADADSRVVEAIAVDDGLVVALGTSEELGQRFAPARRVELEGRTVTPAFIDGHTHINGNPARYVDLEEVPSITELQERVRRRIAELGPGEWITGYGWSEDELAEGRMQTRSDLDEVAPQNPVVLTRAGAHSAIANSLGLAAAGFEEGSADPERGFLGRDADGRLNGIIGERQDLLLALVPEASQQELADSLRGELAEQFGHGITTIVHANATVADLPLWRLAYENAAASGQALPRAEVQVIWPGVDAAEEMRSAFDDIPGVSADQLTLGPIKIFVDGGFTGPAAYTREPYASAGRGRGGDTPPGYRGELNLPKEVFEQAILDAHSNGWQLGIHAIGDAAIELTVDWLAAALDAAPREDHRHYLNHFTVMPSPETMQTMAQRGIHVTQQPNFTFSVEGRYVQHLDGERLERNNPLRTPIEYGIHLAISSDILPIGPMVGLEAAVSRQGRSGRVYAADEALTVPEAIRAMTWAGAFLLHREDRLGTLEVGKQADLVVLSCDLLTTEPQQLSEVLVDLTLMAGEVVFER